MKDTSGKPKIVRFGDIEFEKINNIIFPHLKININDKHYATMTFCNENGTIFITREKDDKFIASSNDNIILPELCKYASADIVNIVIDYRVLNMLSTLFGSLDYTIPNINYSQEYVIFRNCIYNFFKKYNNV